MLARFNVNPVVLGRSIDDPPQSEISHALNLRQASLENAAKYGGEITRRALGAMDLRGDRKYVVVDTRVSMLLPGFMPSIPGWHTDGVPRGEDLNPSGHGEPNIEAQINGEISAPRYHLLVTGTHCPTRFINEELIVNVLNSPNLYKDMSSKINKMCENFQALDEPIELFDTPPSTVVEWDWWNIHTAQAATARGWRYLIRVTETDHIVPKTSPADFIRTQTQVYVPTEFGW